MKVHLHYLLDQIFNGCPKSGRIIGVRGDVAYKPGEKIVIKINDKQGQPSFSPFMLGHKDLGGKEVLSLIDGIFTSKLNERGMIKHWNNPQDRQYSRNLGKDKGIELVSISLK